MSFTKYKPEKLNPIGKLCIFVFKTLRVIQLQEKKGEDGLYTECNNMTLINLLLKFFGPMHERTLVIILMGIQVGYLHTMVRKNLLILHQIWCIFFNLKQFLILVLNSRILPYTFRSIT